MGNLREEIVVGRGDPVYLAHAYLTKVPVPAIFPFLESYSSRGDLVVDPFAGSGMTGVAAKIMGRNSRVSDISVLGRHIGKNYLNLVNHDLFDDLVSSVVRRAKDRTASLYQAECSRCKNDAEIIKTVWSTVLECSHCKTPVNYYQSLRNANWVKKTIKCPSCNELINARMNKIGEVPVNEYVKCECSSKQFEQLPSSAPVIDLANYSYPNTQITEDREMYRSSALGKSGNTKISSFYSPRNLASLAVLFDEIESVEDQSFRSKLKFAFTAILTRASKRYQWSIKGPLNAANQNYYIAPIFYEWNIFDLYCRKIKAVLKSDKWIQENMQALGGESAETTNEYVNESATSLSISDKSVDYIFTDPPFGSNLFYSDMALFQEAWLGNFTDMELEAVVDRKTGTSRDAGRYSRLLTEALSECRRILKDDGFVSMVFGNSSGKVWSVVQQAVSESGLEIIPDQIAILNKGQRSVKGLASGMEAVATLDLVLTMRKAEGAQADLITPSASQVRQATLKFATHSTPSHVYLELLRYALQQNWSVANVDLKTAINALQENGWELNPKTGLLTRLEPGALFNLQ